MCIVILILGSMQTDAFFTNLLAAHCALLRERLQYFVDTLPLPLRDDVVQVFKEPGKLFTSQENGSFPGRWALIPFLVAQGIHPDINPRLAGDVAVAVEMSICGGDLIDDIEDGDQSTIIQALGPARGLNVAITLLLLAQKVLLSLLDEAVDQRLVLALLNVWVNASLKSANGQHLDILSENELFADMNEEESISIIALKSGSLMSVIMELGALCAGAESEVCDKFAKCGRLLGIAYQLDNNREDLYDLIYSGGDATIRTSLQGPVKNDSIRKKKTLPTVMTSAQEGKLQGDEDKENAIREKIIASRGVSLLYRERALECLLELEKKNVSSPLLRFLLQL